MSTTSISLPAWLQRHGVTILCLLVILLITLSLTKQSIDYLRLLRSEAPSSPPPSATDQSPQVSLQQVQNMFGVPKVRATGDQNAPPTQQKMTLLASFVSPDAQRSTAVIQFDGEKPRRIAVGNEVNASTRLQAVYQDHVVLERDGREESLRFPAVRNPALTPYSAAPSPYTPEEPTAQQLEQLQDEDVQALQERIQQLQQRMEGGEEVPQPEILETE